MCKCTECFDFDCKPLELKASMPVLVHVYRMFRVMRKYWLELHNIRSSLPNDTLGHLGHLVDIP